MKRALAVLMLFVVSACGGGDTTGSGLASRAPSVPGGSNSDRLPDAFPADFPLPEDRKVVYSITPNDATGVVYLDADQSPGELLDFYTDELPKAGWTITTCVVANVSPAPVRVLQAVKGDTSVTVTVGTKAEPPGGIDAEYTFWLSYVTGSTVAAVTPVPATCPPQ